MELQWDELQTTDEPMKTIPAIFIENLLYKSKERNLSAAHKASLTL